MKTISIVKIDNEVWFRDENIDDMNELMGIEYFTQSSESDGQESPNGEANYLAAMI